MRACAWVLAVTVIISSTVSAQESGRSSVVCEDPPPLSEAGLRFAWEEEPENSPFREGSWVGMTYAAMVLGTFKDDAQIFGGYAGLGYHYRSNASISVILGANFGDKNINRDTGVNQGDFFGGSIQLLARNHLINYGSWSAFVEAGLGFSVLSDPVPADGTTYNFMLTAGAGITKQLDECTHLILGCRWHHLSNGSFFNPANLNPGYDGKMVYAGLLFSY